MSDVLVARVTENRYFEYHDGDWWNIHVENMLSSEIEMGQFLVGIIRYLKPSITVETGCNAGHTTRFLGEAHAENLKGKVISCDTNPESVKKAQEYCGLSPIEIRNCASLDLPELAEADVVFSDSDFPTRVQEFSKVKKGCVFIVHDTALVPELGEFVTKNGGINFNKGRGFGIIQKQ